MDRTQALDVLRQGVKTFADSESFRAYLETRSRFRTYSFNNTMMIHFQRPGATYVAGFRKWLELGRYVRKGEKGIAIFAPMMYAKKDQDGNKTGDILRGFRVVHVFDYSQTDGNPLPEPPMPKELTGDEGGDMFDALRDFAEHGGLSVLPSFGEFPDERNGDYTPAEKRIRIRAGLSMLQRVKTMAHECAHWILHTSPEGAQLAREVKETEAEAAAFLALAGFGLRSDQYSFAYVAHWASGDLKILESSLARIERAATEIAHAVQSRIGSPVNASPALATAEGVERG